MKLLKINHLIFLLSIWQLGCSGNNFSFQDIQLSCTPPKASARYGKNQGPVITQPEANTPANGTMTVQGTCVDGSDVTLAGSGLNSSVTTSCSSGAFSTVVSFKSGDGIKELDVSQPAVSDASVFDRRCFMQDTIPPKVTISGSNGAQAVPSSTVRVEGTCESGLTVVVSGPNLTAPASVACTAGRFSTLVSFTGPDGLKDIIAKQVDRAGNNGQDNGQYQIDTHPPIVTITTPSAMSQSTGAITVTGTCEVGPKVILTGGLSGSLNVADCANGAFSAAITLSNGDGVKNIKAAQTDIAGNVGSANRDVVKDATAPAVHITAPAANSKSLGNITLAGTCESGLTVNIYGAGISAATSTSCTNNAFSAGISLSVGDGNKQIAVSQTDAVGNVGSDSRNFIRDASAPVVTISSPAANSVYKSALILQGTCESGLTVKISGPGALSPLNTPCNSNNYSALVNLSAGEGSKTLTASQTDSVGNTGSATRSFIRDSVAPTIEITAPAAGTVAQTGLTLSGNCETGLPINLSGPGILSPINTTCSAGHFSQAISFSNGEGAKRITASQTDSAGNVGTSQREFIRDSIAPLVSILSPAPNTASATGLTISGQCENGIVVNISGDVSALSTTNCSGNKYSAAITFSAPMGAKNITVSQTDSANNTGTATRTFIKANNAGYEMFTSRGPKGKVDIIFVDDNSASMEQEQSALGSKFSAFTSALSKLDWHVGIITTDCTNGSPYNHCGQLYDMTGQAPGTYFLTPSSPAYLNSFKNTIQRPETKNCLLTNSCPSGREEGLLSTIQAMNLRNADNAGFFRDDADLAVVILTDEDEASNAPSDATTPAQVINAFNNIWGTTKKFSSHAIIVKPGDVACLNAQKQQLGNNAYYGTYPDHLAFLTGGLSVSICEPDYSSTLKDIAENVSQLSYSMMLAHTPIAGTISVNFTPSFTTTWTVVNNKITFAALPPQGTKVEIFYQY